MSRYCTMKGGSMTTRERVVDQYRQQGAQTIGECAQRLGVYPDLVRPHVKPPVFEAVGSKRMGEKMVWATVWRLTREGLYVHTPVSTLTAIDDGGTVHRRDGSDPWPGVVVAEAG